MPGRPARPRPTRRRHLTQATLSAAAQASLAIWHRMIATHSMDELDGIVADEVVFHSPVAHTPYPGRAALRMVLETVNQVFQDFRYHRGFVGDDGRSVVLEFSARVDGKAVKAIDMIRFDANGRIDDFEVMVRPKSGLDALAAAMGARLAGQTSVLHGA
ncbi:nuclear transport factor 2 family protein [Cupriavidus basilensis]|uniref:nuclear transport factor 2 family protein n=1 Tax=Cupriavidus basilensis TaxID=68895 RepID=UPI00351BF7E3